MQNEILSEYYYTVSWFHMKPCFSVGWVGGKKDEEQTQEEYKPQTKQRKNVGILGF